MKTDVTLKIAGAAGEGIQTIGDLLEDIGDDHPDWRNHDYLKAKQVRDAAAGKGFANRCLLTASDTSIATAPRTYAKRQSTSPFLVRDDGMERLFTPKELCRATGRFYMAIFPTAFLLL